MQGAVDVGANPSAKVANVDDGVDDQVVKVVDIVGTFRLQEKLAFDKKQSVTCMKRFIKNLAPKLAGKQAENFKKHIDGVQKEKKYRGREDGKLQSNILSFFFFLTPLLSTS